MTKQKIIAVKFNKELWDKREALNIKTYDIQTGIEIDCILYNREIKKYWGAIGDFLVAEHRLVMILPKPVKELFTGLIIHRQFYREKIWEEEIEVDD